jgi:hypothetical protein
MEIAHEDNDAGDPMIVLTRSDDAFRKDDHDQFQVWVHPEKSAVNEFMRCVDTKIDDWTGEPTALIDACWPVSNE